MTEQNFIAPEGREHTDNQKTTNPFWFRENSSYLYGVTSAGSNMTFGIQNIKLSPASANQTPYGILANGLLRTVVGTISFQVRLSKSHAPFVSTITSAYGDENNKQYWEHIVLTPQAKAQILRHFEARETNTVPPVVQNGMNMNPYANVAHNPYGMQPVQGQPMPGQPPVYPGYGAMNQGVPAGAGQAPQYPNYANYQAPSQNLDNVTTDNGEPVNTETGEIGSSESSDLTADNLPI